MKFGRRTITSWFVAAALGLSLMRGTAATFYQGVTPTSVPWPGGVVPYEFDTNNITAQQQEVYLDGMREWELAANITFIPHTTESNYVILEFDAGQGTNTYVASVPPVMTIDSLSRAQICHETGHLLGFQHEHVRTNRDDYITVDFDNLQSGLAGEGPGSGGISNLYVIDTNSTSYGPYDFESVMHYGRRLFAADPNVDVISPLPQYVDHYYNRIGNLCISPLDRAGAAYLYGPPTTPLTNVVTTTADVGFGSLRAAIYYANDNPGTTITFNIPNTDAGFTNGVYTIYLTGELPPLVTDGTIIDGTSQPGFTNTPVIAIDGSRLLPEAQGASGIHFYESDCALRGLAIQNVTFSAVEMLYNFCASNHVEGCFLGLAPDGVNAQPNGFEGVNIAGGAHGNVIGGTDPTQRNVISGNVFSYGVTVTETNSDGNVIQGNYLGLDASGTLSVSNGYSGVGVWGGAVGTVIGGTDPGAGNVISGNGQYGIFIGDPDTTGTIVQGNYIGTDATGSQPIANAFGGIAVFNGANGVSIGGSNPGARNVISGNGTVGIYLLGSGASNNVIQGNFVGLDATGTTAVPNSFAGIYVIGGAQNNLIGGGNPGEGNIISGNASEAIYIADPGTSNNLVVGNFLGTDTTGFNPVPNGFTGVGIWNGAENNFIGGTNSGEGNLISGNGANGVSIGDTNTSGNVVQGNLIGTTMAGTGSLTNNSWGVYIVSGASANLIGGNSPAARNVISGNGQDGIFLYGAGTSSNNIFGNYIGVTINGTAPLPNGHSGVTIINGASANNIGTPDTATRNIIAGNLGDGIFISSRGTASNSIQGNFIGTDFTGLTAISNLMEGVVVAGGAQGNQIGGASTGAGNVIAANSFRGVLISDGGTTGNLVQGNDIGVGADGVTQLGNGMEGIVLRNGAASNLIGLDTNGVGAGNQITYSGREGVAVYDNATTGNTIRGNAIFNNTRLAINLVGGVEDSFGVTANDLQDADTGPNNLQNFPVITNASVAGGVTTISGTLNSTPNRSFLIDVYSNPDADVSGYGPGTIYLGNVSIISDANGNGSFIFTTNTDLTGQFIATTATDAATGDTSEFSADVLAAVNTPPPPPPITLSGALIDTNGLFGFNINVQSNQQFRVQATTNLVDSNAWVDLTNFTATTSPVFFEDSNSSNLWQRFYRVASP